MQRFKKKIQTKEMNDFAEHVMNNAMGQVIIRNEAPTNNTTNPNVRGIKFNSSII